MCLCSVSTPEKIVSILYTYLKPGGTLLVLEHVRSDYSIMRILQTLYTNCGWHYLMGCELNRPTTDFLLECGQTSERNGWKEVELRNTPGQGWWSMIPIIVGKLVKV